MRSKYVDIGLEDGLRLYYNYYKYGNNYNSSSILVDFNGRVIAMNIIDTCYLSILQIGGLYNSDKIRVNGKMVQLKKDLYFSEAKIKTWGISNLNKLITYFNEHFDNYKIDLLKYKRNINNNLLQDEIISDTMTASELKDDLGDTVLQGE